MDIEENISKINEHIERVKEYLEYGMPYSEYLDLQISFETILNELDKKDKIIDKIYDFCRRELAFEKRLKREKRKPDEFNQGRFYVCENIKAIITNKVEEDIKQ